MSDRTVVFMPLIDPFDPQCARGIAANGVRQQKQTTDHFQYINEGTRRVS